MSTPLRAVLPWFLGPLLLLRLCAACGGSSGGQLPASDPDPSIAPGLDASETPPPPSPSEAGVPAEAGPDGGAPDARIDPIEVGRAWTYNVQVLGYYPTCDNGVHTATALSARQIDGKNGIDVQSLCKGSGTYAYAVEGDRVWSHYSGAWRLSLDAPVQQGHSWSDDFATYTWEPKGTVTTAAGMFTDCWSATKQVAQASYTVFCRGVGPVHWHYEDAFGNGYDAILVSKNF